MNPVRGKTSEMFADSYASRASNGVNVKIEPSWGEKLKGEFEKEYFAELTKFVKKEYKEGTVYPAPKNIFRAFDLCPFDKVKVVILGQDPYHGVGQANGLAFAVNEETALPPSLQNIYKEIASDCGYPMSTKNGDLSRWAEQGVLLLNATLTVRAHSAGSHQGKGWEEFTEAVIRALSEERARSSVRFSFGRLTEEREIKEALKLAAGILKK